MPTFLARRYRRTQVGRIERIAGVLILLLLAGVIAGFIYQSLTDRGYLFVVGDEALKVTGKIGAGSMREPGQASGSETAPPGGPAGDAFPALAGGEWRAPQQAARYTPDNLYMKIDGRADLYLQYQVVGLLFGSYGNSADPQRTIDVYWYDMGKPENAAGIYRAEAPPDAQPAVVGRQGYRAEGAVFFIKGAGYVQVLPTSADAADGEAAMQIAQRIAERITESEQEDWASKALPKAGRVEGSLEFIATDAFDLDFLSGVYTAEYEAAGGRIKLFVHRADDAAAANSLFEKYKVFFAEFGKIVWTDPDESRRMVAGLVSGEVDVVFVKGRYLGGVAEAEDLEAAKKAASAFFEALDTRR